MKLTQHKRFSPKQVARSITVSEASIKRWCDKGILSFTKTAGGHRKIPLYAVLAFVAENGLNLSQPEVLGLPTSVGSDSRSLDQACRLYSRALERGNESVCLELALDLCLSGHDMAVIGDRIIGPAWAMGANGYRSRPAGRSL